MKPETLILIAGVALVTAGAAMQSIPAALIACGGLLIAITIACAWIGRR